MANIIFNLCEHSVAALIPVCFWHWNPITLMLSGVKKSIRIIDKKVTYIISHVMYA